MAQVKGCVEVLYKLILMIKFKKFVTDVKNILFYFLLKGSWRLNSAIEWLLRMNEGLPF